MESRIKERRFETATGNLSRVPFESKEQYLAAAKSECEKRGISFAEYFIWLGKVLCDDEIDYVFFNLTE